MSNKENNIKEQFKQVLISTARVISDDYKIDIKKIDKNSNLKKKKIFEITNLLSPINLEKKFQEMLKLMNLLIQNLLKITKILILKKFMISSLLNIN